MSAAVERISRISCLIIVALLLSCLLTVTLTSTVDASTSGDYDYTLINDGADVMITGYHGAGGSVIIPSTIDGKPVTSIGPSAFDHASMASVTISDSVTSIGDCAFANCGSLTSVTISDSVTYIGGYAFVNCGSLTSVTIPNSVTIIGNGAFANCGSLTSVTIPNSVTYLGNGAFYHCALYSVTMPDSVKFIGGSTFSYCPLTSVTIPSSVVCIYPGAFANCGSLTSIIFKGNVAPTCVYMDWIDGTPAELRGYAPSTSNFPATGESFYGLIMASSASTNTVPSQPIDLRADVDNGSIVLHWSAPSTDGGNNITGYNIYRGTDPTSASLVGEVNATSFTDTNVIEGVSYCYYVVAVNDLGESPASSFVSDEIAASSSTTELGSGDTSPILLNPVIVVLIIASLTCGVLYGVQKGLAVKLNGPFVNWHAMDEKLGGQGKNQADLTAPLSNPCVLSSTFILDTSSSPKSMSSVLVTSMSILRCASRRFLIFPMPDAEGLGVVSLIARPVRSSLNGTTSSRHYWTKRFDPPFHLAELKRRWSCP